MLNFFLSVGQIELFLDMEYEYRRKNDKYTQTDEGNLHLS